MPSNTDRSPISRRRVLSGGAIAIATALAGCGSGRSDPTSPSAGTETTSTPMDDADDADDSDDADDTEPNRSADQLVGPWPIDSGTPGRTGALTVPDDGIGWGPMDDPTTVWSAGGRALRESMIPAVGDDLVAVASEGSPLRVLDSMTAQERADDLLINEPGADEPWLWTADVRGWNPTVADDGVYLVEDEALVALDRSGTERWRNEADHARLFQPVVSDDLVFASGGGGLQALERDAGGERWFLDVRGEAYPPVRVDDLVMTAVDDHSNREDGSIICVDAAGGDVVWEVELARTPAGGPVVVEGEEGSVVVGSSNAGDVVAIDPTSGDRLWTVPEDRDTLDESEWVTDLVALDDGVAAIRLGGTVDCFDADGRLRWQRDVGGTVLRPTVADGGLVLGRREGGVVALNLASGSTEWEASDPRGIVAVASDDQAVYVAGDGGVLTILAAGTGREQWRLVDRPRRLPGPIVSGSAAYVTARRLTAAGFPVVGPEVGRSVWSGRTLARPVGSGIALEDGIAIAGADGTLHVEGAFDGEAAPNRPLGPDDDGDDDLHVDYPPADSRSELDLGSPIVAGAGVSGETLLVPTEAGLVGVDVSGETLDAELLREIDGTPSTPPAATSEMAYVPTEGLLHGIDLGGGTGSWTGGIGVIEAAPAASELGVALGTVEGTLRLLGRDGSDRWHEAVGAPIRSSPALVERSDAESDDAGSVVVGDDAGVLHCFDAADGAERWRVETDGAIRSDPAVADDVVYVGSRDGGLYAVDLNNGAVLWRHSIGDWVDGGPAIAYGAVFVLDGGGTLHAVVEGE